MSIEMNENMSYQRVIPRDFFNEAKLLKCMGRLSLLVHDEKAPAGIEIKETGLRFLVELADDGALYVCNYLTKINGKFVQFRTTYNSKSPYPFFVQYETESDTIECEVFNDEGEFTEDFLQFCKEL